MKEHNIEDGQVTVRVIPSVQYVLKGIVNKMNLLFEFEVHKKTEAEEVRRGPIELSLVLDRSGSMQGEKIRFAKVAIQEVIDNLRSDDKIHLVIYDDIVERVIEDGDLRHRQHLKSLVESVAARGSTFLYGGLQEGYRVMSDEHGGRSPRIFLFSDGLANVGVRDNEGILSLVRDIHGHGVNISSFGIGRDFNEDLMEGIAEQGAGDYFYIDMADRIPDIVSEALEGFLSTVMTNTVLKVKGQRGVRVTKIYGYSPSNVLLGDLRDGEIRQVLVELEVIPEHLTNGELVEFSLEYSLLDSPLENREFSSRVTVELTDDETKIVDEDESVLIAKKLLEVAEMERVAVNHVENRRYAPAISIIQRAREVLLGVQSRDKTGRVSDKLKMLEVTEQKVRNDQRRRTFRDSSKQMKYSSYQTRSSKSRRMR